MDVLIYELILRIVDIMKIILENNSSKNAIEIEVTRTLHDLHLKINKVYHLSDSKYQYRFGKRMYTLNGPFNTISHHCDLLIYEKEPVEYRCGKLASEIFHSNISSSIYDYCDFNESHYCSVFEQIIDIDACYDAMMILNGYFKVESSKALEVIRDIDLAREKCKNCIYANCDSIDYELTQKNIALEEFVHRSEGVNLHNSIIYTKPRSR